MESSFIGSGEKASIEILKQMTNLPERHNKDFHKYSNGLYKQLPLKEVIHEHDYNLLSTEHKKGTIDIFLVLNQVKIAIRVQGKGHGMGEKHHGRYSLRGIGKVKHDKVQEDLIKKYNLLVDVDFRECKTLFTDIVNDKSKKELIDSFKTAKISIPVLLK